MNATLLAFLNNHYPNWVNILFDVEQLHEGMGIIFEAKDFCRSHLLDFDTYDMLTYARRHYNLLIPATGKHTPYRAPRM